MTTQSLTGRLTEALLAALSLPADDDTYALVYSAALNADEAEVPDPRLQALLVVEAVEEALGLGLDEIRLESAVAAVMAVLPTRVELEAHWQTNRAAGPPREIPPDAFLEMAFEDRVNGGLDLD